MFTKADEFGRLFYESNCIYDYSNAVRDLVNNYQKNKSKKKVILCNYNREEVLGTEKRDYSVHQEKYDNAKSETKREEYSSFFADLELEYIEELQRELQAEHKNLKTKKNIEAISLKILLPNIISEKNNAYSYEKLAFKLIRSLKDDSVVLPYIATVTRQGKGLYLDIIYIDKPYYKNGKKIVTYNKKNFYFEKKSKIQRSEEYALENGLDNFIMYRPGEFKKTYIKNWGVKVTDFWLGAKCHLESRRNNILSIIKSIFSSLKGQNTDMFKSNLINRVRLRKSIIKDYYNENVSNDETEEKYIDGFIRRKIRSYIVRKNRAINSVVATLNKCYFEGKIEIKEKEDWKEFLNQMIYIKSNVLEYEILTTDICKKIENGEKYNLIPY